MGALGAGRSAGAARVLVVTDDPDTLEEVLRLAAAAGMEVEAAARPGAARGSWARSPLVLVGADCADAAAAAALARRRDVVVVCVGLAPPWHAAVALGADHVVELPAGQQWLVERLSEAAAGPSREAAVVAAVGGRGGAGASTWAAAVSLAASRSGYRVLLLDADPLGGGLDLALGAEDSAGLRWPDLADTQGRLPPSALDGALPRAQSLTVLSWDRGDLVVVPRAALSAVLDAGVRGFDLVVVDLPRRPDDAAAEVLSRSACTWVVVPREVRATASAARVLSVLSPLTATVAAVVRGPAPSGLTAREVAEALDIPLAVDMRPEPALAGLLDRGEPLRRRGPLAAAASAAVAAVLDGRAGAA